MYPDPKTSGGARWNVNAIYGAGLFHASRSRPDREAARELLARVQANVITMDASGRQSMATFDRGTGDAIVTYENELLLQSKLQGQVPPYVIPPATLLDRRTGGRRRRFRGSPRQSQAGRGIS